MKKQENKLEKKYKYCMLLTNLMQIKWGDVDNFDNCFQCNISKDVDALLMGGLWCSGYKKLATWKLRYWNLHHSHGLICLDWGVSVNWACVAD